MTAEHTQRASKGPHHDVATSLDSQQLEVVDQYASMHGVTREVALGRLAAMGSKIVADSTRKRLGLACR